MLAQEIRKLENENYVLKEQLKELSKKMEQNEVVKPKSCQYCKHFIQHYMRDRSGVHRQEYTPIYAGHCTSGVSISKGGRRKPTPDDTCQYFEIGTHEAKYL